MVVIVKKTSFERLKPRVMNYRYYKSFENKLIQKKLLYELSNATLEKNADDFKEFIEICQKTLNDHDHLASFKQKFLRGSHLPFMKKPLPKAIMYRTRFRNINTLEKLT